MAFDPKKYRRRIRESRRRYETTARFEEPDRVPIRISASGSYWCWLNGVNIRDYYLDLDTEIEVQLKGMEWAFEELRDDRTGCGFHAEAGPIGEALLWDREVVRPDNTSPWIVPWVHTLEDIERLEVPDPAQSTGVRWALQRREEMQEKVARLGLEAIGVGGGVGIHPPLSCACALAPADRVYEWMYTAPEHVHLFFRKCFDAFCALTDYMDQVNGAAEHTVLGLADDNSAFVSPAMYKEFVFPYNKALYDRYGSERRHFHADGPNNHHFEMYANEMKLTHMDIGGWSDIAAAKKHLAGKVVMSGGLNCRDLYGAFEQAKPAIERAIRIGAPGGGYIFAIGGETYVGVNPDTLIRTVEYAKEIGRYPIQA